ncbi:hypothetical protein SKAU_G00109110 [Synaphobranchus kaupii]|uniref:TMCC1 n=1 Tax=Synaphobranchus kaupii TaxID=118154 RepID=A0A9Q1FZW8_SYNKA|nr:hypothetical protein SKAU_G00109110 [Synaphobranchus kaupii]
MDHSDSEQNHEELDPGGQGVLDPESRRASEPEHSLSKITHNALENIGVLGQGLKQLFHPQRRRSSVSPHGAGSSPSASSTGSPAPEPLEAGPEAGDVPPALPDTDPHASAHPTALNRVLQQIRGAPMMKRGTSLQSRRSKAAGDPPKGSPQIHRRGTQEALIQAGRPRSSSTTDTPSSPALAEVLLAFPSAECEPERDAPTLCHRTRPRPYVCVLLRGGGLRLGQEDGMGWDGMGRGGACVRELRRSARAHWLYARYRETAHLSPAGICESTAGPAAC